MKHFVIFNPGARDGRGKKKITKIIKLLRKNNIDFEYKITKTFDDAYKFSKEAIQKFYDVIIAVGGDGTINQVINGFFDDDGKKISSSLFGVIYTGTSPDFCKNYNIPIKIEKAISIIKNKKHKPIKIGKIKFMKNCNDTICITRYFTCCANIGIGASLAQNANSGIRKIFGDFFGTFISLIKVLFVYRANNFEILIDNKKKTIKKLYNLSIGKTFHIASGIKIRNELEKNEKDFYLLTIKNLNLLRTVNVIKRIYSGKKIEGNKSISLSYCNKIEIMKNDINPQIEFDGDPAGYLPCVIQKADNHLDVICNQKGKI